VTDLPAEAVEAAARALHLDDCRSTGHDEGDCWDETEKWERAVYRSNATAALAAAVPLLREAWETEGQRAVCSGGGPSREPGKVLIEFRVDDGTDRRLSDEWLLIPLGSRDV
jgi:hypothetical protein